MPRIATVQPSCCASPTSVTYADLQLYIDGHSRGTTIDQQQEVIVRWANVLQWFSVRASWVHSIEIRNFSDDFAAQHDCPSGMYALQALYLEVIQLLSIVQIVLCTNAADIFHT